MTARPAGAWPSRRVFGAWIATLVLLPDKGTGAAEDAQVVAVEARRFTFEPREIRLHPGRPTRLEITSRDFFHGISVPALGIRVDLPAGLTTTVALPPIAPGIYAFLCDNFCGSGHEEMGGRIVVEG